MVRRGNAVLSGAARRGLAAASIRLVTDAVAETPQRAGCALRAKNPALLRGRKTPRDHVASRARDGAIAISRQLASGPPPGPPPLPELPLKWDAAHACGHALLDDQHRTLFRDANALLASSQRGAPDVLARFDELISHILGHFADEERVLREIRYPAHEAHRRLHMRLTERALKLREGMIAGRQRHEELLQFLLVDVVARHLLVEDRQFFAALEQHGH